MPRSSKKLQETRECNVPSTECIPEAIEITMSSNSRRFNDRFFTQVDGATIGSPDSESVTDIFGAIHIDKKFIEESSRKPENYKRYRDDPIDIVRNSSEKEQKQITEWMNNNIYLNKIIFKIESIGQEVNFLDTKVQLMKDERLDGDNQFFLIPNMYSTNSCHTKHVTNNIPTIVVTRCRINCSDCIENDKLFKDTLIYYKAYLIKSGYKEADISRKSINSAIKKKRKSILKKKNKNKQSIQKYRFVTNFEPSFPDIAKGFRKFKRILEDDEDLMEVFPQGVKHFQVTQKRGCKNMKEILAPLTVKISHETPPPPPEYYLSDYL